MIHFATESAPQEDHYAVGKSGTGHGVLAQLQEKGQQARILLTPQEARHFAQLLLRQADIVENEAAKSLG